VDKRIGESWFAYFVPSTCQMISTRYSAFIEQATSVVAYRYCIDQK